MRNHGNVWKLDPQCSLAFSLPSSMQEKMRALCSVSIKNSSHCIKNMCFKCLDKVVCYDLQIVKERKNLSTYLQRRHPVKNVNWKLLQARVGKFLPQMEKTVPGKIGFCQQKWQKQIFDTLMGIYVLLPILN